MGPKKAKAILCSPFSSLRWPQLTSSEETEILEKVSNLLKSLPEGLKAARTAVTIGMNETTRALERGEIGAVLVQADSPTSYMLQLCAVRSCSAVALVRLSVTLHQVLSVPRTAAIGLKLTSPGCQTLCEYVSRKLETQPVKLEWLNTNTDVFQHVSVGRMPGRKKVQKKKKQKKT